MSASSLHRDSTDSLMVHIIHPSATLSVCIIKLPYYIEQMSAVEHVLILYVYVCTGIWSIN